eukprot:10370106-Alexandrium_andersonii.AAC.1
MGHHDSARVGCLCDVVARALQLPLPRILFPCLLHGDLIYDAVGFQFYQCEEQPVVLHEGPPTYACLHVIAR